MNLDDEAMSIIKISNSLEQKEQEIQKANPGLFAQIKAIEEAKADVDNMWAALKDKLQQNNDYDVHEVKVGNYKCTFSLSKTVKIGVEDIDKVPEEFVSTQKVADEKKLKQYYELYGEMPNGCVDKSFDRLNKKIINEKGE